MILSGALMLRHLGYPDDADRLETAVRDVIADGHATTYDLGGAAGTADFADAIIARLPHAARPDDRRCPPSLGSMTARQPLAPAQAAGHRAARPRRHQPRRRVVAGARSSRARSSRSAPRTCSSAASCWTPLFGDAVRGRRLPLAALLAADRARLAAAWFISPGLLILWIPLGFRATCYYYRKAYYRFYFADPPGCAVGEPTDPPALPDGDGLPVHPPEPPPLLPVSRVHPAVLPVGRRGASLRIEGEWRIGLGRRDPRRQRAPADRLLAVVPLAAPPRRRQARLLLVHAPHAGPLQRSGSG